MTQTEEDQTDTFPADKRRLQGSPFGSKITANNFACGIASTYNFSHSPANKCDEG